MVEKKEKIDQFLIKLNDYIDAKISESKCDCNDSWVGMGSYRSEENLKKSLYELFDIERI